MSRTQRFLMNTAATAAYQITAMLMGLVVPRLMIHFYASEVNGLIVSVTEFINYFKLVEAGLAAAAVYSLYKPLADNDHDRVSAVVSAARRFYNVTGLIFIALTAVFAVIYPFVVSITSMDSLSVGLLVVIMGLSGALEFLTLSRYRVLLTADQRAYMVSLTGMASLLLQTALIVVLSVLRVDILLLRLAAGLTILLRTVLLRRYVKKHYPYVNYRHAPDKSALNSRYDALYSQLTVSLQQSLGVVLTTLIIRDSRVVSVYGVYHMVIIGLWGILKMITTGIYSFFGQMLATGDQKRFQEVYGDFECLYTSLCVVVYAAAQILMLPFVTLYAGNVADINYIRPLWAVLFVLQGVSDQLKTPLDLMVTSAGAFRETRRYNTFQIVIAVGLGAALGAAFGVPGVLCGIILSNVARTGMQLYYVPKHITRLKWTASFKRIARGFISILLITLPFYFFPLAPRSFGMWLVYAVGIGLYCAAMALLSAYLFDRTALRSLLSRLKSLIKRK